MESTKTTFEAFESIKKSKVFTKTDVIRFVEKHTSGFKPQLTKALKFDLDIYVENNLFQDVIEKYEEYRSEENPTYLEIMFNVYENLNKHGYSCTHEAWRLVFDKILSTKFNFEDPLFDTISNFIDLESFIWEEITSRSRSDKQVHHSFDQYGYPKEHGKTQKQIRELAKGITKKDSSKWSEETVFIYLDAFNRNPGCSMPEIIEIVTSSNERFTTNDEISNVPQSTLYEWRKKVNKL